MASTRPDRGAATLARRHPDMWRLCLVVAVCIVSTATCSPNEVPTYTSISASSSRPLFGVRGGAFFGFGRSSKSQGDGGGGDGDLPKRYPALSQEEIEEKLNIPVFGLTDANGNGVVLSDGATGNNIFHFFFSKHMADAALKAVVAANDHDGAPALKVSAFHLGKCWFKLIQGSGTQSYELTKYGKQKGTGASKPVHFRLVPNQKDLMGARILTGLQPGDVEQLKEAVEEPNPPKALSIIQQAANNEGCSFKVPFNEIPVFAIAQMRVRKKDDQTGLPMGENMMPFHLSTKTMSETWNEFVRQSPQFEDVEATLQLIELHKMIDMMLRESDFDWRNVCFIMPHYDKDQPKIDDDSDDDESDDGGGGGGDNGMKVDDPYDYDDISPFVSMELYADAPGQSSGLVQL